MFDDENDMPITAQNEAAKETKLQKVDRRRLIKELF